jgi:hypothetical protein
MDRIEELMRPHSCHFNPVDLADPVIPSRFFIVPVVPPWLTGFLCALAPLRGIFVRFRFEPLTGNG